MGYMDTSDKYKYNCICEIFAKLDVIEHKTGKLAHEVDQVNSLLDLWCKDKLNDKYFNNFLGQFIETL